jgi:hypothetical protein
MAYTPALTMCSTTGRGAAKKRALAGVISAPPANWLRRNTPPAIGIALRRIRATTSHVAERALIGSLGF